MRTTWGGSSVDLKWSSESEFRTSSIESVQMVRFVTLSKGYRRNLSKDLWRTNWFFVCKLTALRTHRSRTFKLWTSKFELFESKSESKSKSEFQTSRECRTIITAKYLDRWTTSQNSIKQFRSASETRNSGSESIWISENVQKRYFDQNNATSSEFAPGMCSRQPLY